MSSFYILKENLKAHNIRSLVCYNFIWKGVIKIQLKKGDVNDEEKLDKKMVIGATLGSVSAHSMYRTFNIKPFAQASTTTYSNGYGSSVTVTFNDNDYNFGAHTVKGTLYW